MKNESDHINQTVSSDMLSLVRYDGMSEFLLKRQEAILSDYKTLTNKQQNTNGYLKPESNKALSFSY